VGPLFWGHTYCVNNGEMRHGITVRLKVSRKEGSGFLGRAGVHCGWDWAGKGRSGSLTSQSSLKCMEEPKLSNLSVSGL
jgi:hypothetical protein